VKEHFAMAETKSLDPIFSEFANDADMRELVEMFLEELPKRVAILQKSLQDGNVSEIARIAHQLKGAAGGYGYPIITDAAAVLERSAKAKEAVDNLTKSVQEISDLCKRAQAATSKG
jgi:HPt (histidine-containing phosphotransfer) domain-containing protein